MKKINIFFILICGIGTTLLRADSIHNDFYSSPNQETKEETSIQEEDKSAEKEYLQKPTMLKQEEKILEDSKTNTNYESYNRKIGHVGITFSTKSELGLYLAYSPKISRFGFYFNFMSTLKNGKGKDYTGIISQGTAENYYQDKLIDTTEQALSMFVGPSFRLNNYLLVFAGVGYTLKTTELTYYDPTHILDSSGYYKIESKDESGGISSEIGIMIFPLSDRKQINLRCSYASFMKSTIFGLGISF